MESGHLDAEVAEEETESKATLQDADRWDVEKAVRLTKWTHLL